MALLSREEALHWVNDNIKQGNLVKHCLAVEAVMERLAEHFGEDEKRWGLAGLLHDLDYDQTAKDPERHSLLSAEWLEEKDIDEDIVYAVKVHNPAHGLPRNGLMDKALYSSDPLTGLIVASALIHPDKKLKSVDTQFVINRFNEKNFAAGASREQIAACEEMDMSLEEFITLGLEGMESIDKELGL
jgi:putative nucleotidyltransferase with HDIG domain